jgi:AAA15 family ATPase/GTPase
MLLSFFVQNFRSILELKVDFTFGEGKAPNGHSQLEVMPFIEAANKLRVVPCLAFFGANASGKTNILKAFGALKKLVHRNDELSALYEPNRINPKFNSTTLAAEFLVGDERFDYRVTYSATAIESESLLKNGRTIFCIRQLTAEFSTEILSPAYPQDRLKEIIRVECSDGEGRQTKTFLGRIGEAYLGLHGDLRSAYRHFKESVKYVPNQMPVPLLFAVAALASTLGGDESKAVREITGCVQRLDIDIKGIDIVEWEMSPDEVAPRGSSEKYDYDTGTRHAVQVKSTHFDIDGSPATFDFFEHESAGTQRLAGLVGLILYTLKTGGVLLVDELECSLHPLLMRELVLLYKRRRHNPKGAQLIFTTHNTDILDDSILRLSEIALVRKTPANGTLMRRLVDARKDGDDIRNVTNFRKQYLAGFYAGIPHPAI